jgi:CDP-diacylglycerol--serine O-phosphatidyltransferase
MRVRSRRRRPPRFRGFSINRLLPNILTTLAMCAGLTAMRFALMERWQLAVVAILIAAILDGLDGRVARLLKGTSPLGAQLDSLSDVVSFGVAPAMVLYLWAMKDAGSLGWIAALAYAVCAALRLARFNARLGDDLPPWAYNYFTGVPAPAGAGLVLLPMMLGFQKILWFVAHPVFVAVWAIAVGLLMVSTLPTFSMKGLKVPDRLIVPVLLATGLTAAALVSAPWPTLTGMGIAYLASLGFSLRQFQRLQRAAEALQEGPRPAHEPGDPAAREALPGPLPSPDMPRAYPKGPHP